MIYKIISGLVDISHHNEIKSDTQPEDTATSSQSLTPRLAHISTHFNRMSGHLANPTFPNI